MKLLLLTLLPTVGLAQTISPHTTSGWAAGCGIGNGLEMHAGYQRQQVLLTSRVRYKLWGPSSGPGSGLFDHRNTHSYQLEVAALAGYNLPIGPVLLYGAAGVSYLTGRQLGEYRYTIHESGLLGNDTHYYAYRNYQAVGLPLELGVFVRFKRLQIVRPGLTFQANLNPAQPVYCVLASFWLSNAGHARRQVFSDFTK